MLHQLSPALLAAAETFSLVAFPKGTFTLGAFPEGTFSLVLFQKAPWSFWRLALSNTMPFGALLSLFTRGGMTKCLPSSQAVRPGLPLGCPWCAAEGFVKMVEPMLFWCTRNSSKSPWELGNDPLQRKAVGIFFFYLFLLRPS